MKRQRGFRFTAALLILCLFTSFSPRAEAYETVLPSGLRLIEDEAFCGASGLTSVTVPRGVKRIGSKAFAYTGLEEISLPSSVIYIAEDAFEGVGRIKATAPEGSYAWLYCVRHGWIDPGVCFYHQNLKNGRLSFPDGALPGTTDSLTVFAPGDWELTFDLVAPTDRWWLSADRTTGTGSDTVTLQVLYAPAKKDYKVAETYVCRLTLTCGKESRSVYVTLSKDGKFITRHINTGNHAEDIVAVAESQIGYHGGTGPDDLDGDPEVLVDKNYTKYTIFLRVGATAWCAAFASWCAWQAGARGIVPGSTVASPGKMMGSNIYNCTVYYFNHLNKTQKQNHPYLETVGVYRSRSQCWPKRGDFIFFRWADAADSTTFSHVGIVTDCSGGQITYIDGNLGKTDSVSIHTIAHDDTNIAAYFTPW